MEDAAKHLDALLELSPDARSEAAEVLLLSLETELDDDTESAWRDEILRRISDSSPGISAATVFAEGKARLQRA